MLTPTGKSWNRRAPNEGLSLYSQGLHPKPRFYKYVWQVWTPDCELEGGEFFEKGPRLSTAQYMELAKEMHKTGKPGWVYDAQYPRSGPGTPFDLAHPRWARAKFAPSWDEDPDPIWNGHKRRYGGG